MRLINADEAEKKIATLARIARSDQQKALLGRCMYIVEHCQTVDAVPVVRCKECMHFRNGICEKIEYIMDGYYHGTFEEKRPDDFCSYGEKKRRGKVCEAD